MTTPFQAIEETKIAKKMLATGSTRGMVDAHLRKEGLSEHLRSEVIRAAANSVNRRAKLKSIAIAIGGILLSCAGGYLYYLCLVNGIRGIKIAIALFMAGLIVAIYGLYGASQNQI